MNLNHLRHLIALSEQQSFRKAAETLFLTQSALSRSIQSLEEELGVTLIDRSGQKQTLTSYGEFAVLTARRVIVEAAELKRGIRQLSNGELGALSVGYGSGPAAVLEVAFFRYMAQTFPRVVVRAARGATELLVQSLRTEKHDVLVVDRRVLVLSDDLNIEPLPPLRGGFICRSGHPLLSQMPVDLAGLQAYPVASTPLSHEVGRILAEGLGPGGHPDQLVTMVGQDVDALLNVVEDSDAIFFGIMAGAHGRLASGKLAELATCLPETLYGNFALVTLARRTPPPAFKLFRDFVVDRFHD
jgi:DNA-binding transcriptional LysR family regulator